MNVERSVGSSTQRNPKRSMHRKKVIGGGGMRFAVGGEKDVII